MLAAESSASTAAGQRTCLRAGLKATGADEAVADICKLATEPFTAGSMNKQALADQQVETAQNISYPHSDLFFFLSNSSYKKL